MRLSPRPFVCPVTCRLDSRGVTKGGSLARCHPSGICSRCHAARRRQKSRDRFIEPLHLLRDVPTYSPRRQRDPWAALFFCLEGLAPEGLGC